MEQSAQNAQFDGMNGWNELVIRFVAVCSDGSLCCFIYNMSDLVIVRHPAHSNLISYLLPAPSIGVAGAYASLIHRYHSSLCKLQSERL